MTVSIGMAMVESEDETFAQAMERADQALYLAKQQGRNRVESLGQGQLTLVSSDAEVA